MLLNDFPDKIRQILIRLPYRVGYYISISDIKGGKEAQDTEIKALENLLYDYHENALKSEFSQEVFSQTLEEKDHWTAWNKNIKTIHKECRNIFAYLDNILEDKDKIAFKRNLLEIGVTVALAHAEFKEKETIFEKIRTKLNYIIRFIDALKTRTRLTPKETYHIKPHANISKAERVALLRLSHTLGVSYD